METIFSSRRNASRRSTMTSGSVYQATPFGTPPLGRQGSSVDPLRGYITGLSSSQHSSTCSGSSSWVLWRDEPNSLYRDPRARRGRLCSALLAVAVFLVVITVLAIAGLAVYMGALRIDTNKPELVFDGSVRITSGDTFLPALGNNSSLAFKEMALKYQNMIDKVYQRSQLRPAYKKCVIERFENGSIVVFFRLYLDRRKIPRSFQNVEETARDILVNELISPRTAAFKNIQIDATSIFIKRSLDDAIITTTEGSSKKKPSDNRTLEIRNGVLRKTQARNTTSQAGENKPGVLSAIAEVSDPSDGEIPTIEGALIVGDGDKDNSVNEPSVASEDKNEMIITDTFNSKHRPPETKGEAVPVVEGTVIVTRIKETFIDRPLQVSGISKKGISTTNSKTEGNNVSDVKYPSNSGSKEETGEDGEESISDYTVNKKYETDLLENNTQSSKKSEKEIAETPGGESELMYSEDPISHKTSSSYLFNKNETVVKTEAENDELLTKFSAGDAVKKNITSISEEDHVLNHDGKVEMSVGISEGLDDKISQTILKTVMEKITEKDIPLIGSSLIHNPDDFTANPLNFKTNTYKDRYQSQATPSFNFDFWDTVSKNTPVPPNTNANEKSPHAQTEEPWRPIPPYYTKHSPKPDHTPNSDEGDGTGTGVAEVMVVPPSAIDSLENSKVSNDQYEVPPYHDNSYSSRLGQPAYQPNSHSEPHRQQASFPSGYGSFSLHTEPQKSQLNDTVSRVSLHVIGSSDVRGEHLETSVLHTTSGGGIIVRKQQQRPFMTATSLPPHTIPLTYTTTAAPSTQRSIANPFTVPELPILHQFHNIDTMLKTLPVKSREPVPALTHQESDSFLNDFEGSSKWVRNSSTNATLKNTDIKAISRTPNLGTGSLSPIDTISDDQQWIKLVNVTTSVAQPAMKGNSHRDVYPIRHFQSPIWHDMGNQGRPGNSKMPFKGGAVPSVVTSVESSSSRVQVNKSTRTEPLSDLGMTMGNTPLPIVTLLPVRSNSGVGRPLRPRPKLPSPASIQTKNKTDTIEVILNSEYILGNNSTERITTFSPVNLYKHPLRPIDSQIINSKANETLVISTDDLTRRSQLKFPSYVAIRPKNKTETNYSEISSSLSSGEVGIQVKSSTPVSTKQPNVHTTIQYLDYKNANRLSTEAGINRFKYSTQPPMMSKTSELPASQETSASSSVSTTRYSTLKVITKASTTRPTIEIRLTTVKPTLSTMKVTSIGTQQSNAKLTTMSSKQTMLSPNTFTLTTPSTVSLLKEINNHLPSKSTKVKSTTIETSSLTSTSSSSSSSIASLSTSSSSTATASPSSSTASSSTSSSTGSSSPSSSSKASSPPSSSTLSLSSPSSSSSSTALSSPSSSTASSSPSSSSVSSSSSSSSSSFSSFSSLMSTKFSASAKKTSPSTSLFNTTMASSSVITPAIKNSHYGNINLPTNSNQNYTNKTATDHIENITRIIDKVVKMSSSSTSTQSSSSVVRGEVQINSALNNTGSNRTKIKIMNSENPSTSPSLKQHILITTATVSPPSSKESNVTTEKDKDSPWHLETQSSLPTTKNSSSIVSLQKPSTVRTSNEMEGLFIPVIVVQDPSDHFWFQNNLTKTISNITSQHNTTSKTEVNIRAVPVTKNKTFVGTEQMPTLKPEENKLNMTNKNVTNSAVIFKKQTVTKTGTIVANKSQMQRSSESEERKNSTMERMNQSESVLQITQKKNNTQLIENLKTEEEIATLTNITPQPNVMATTQVVVLNTDVVTTTSLEISYGENKEQITENPLKTFSSTKNTVFSPKINETVYNNYTKSPQPEKQPETNQSTIVNLPISLVTVSPILIEKSSTQKAKENKESRRQPKMTAKDVYAPAFENFRLDERMMDSTGNLKLEDKINTDMLPESITLNVPDVTEQPVIPTTFSNEGTNNVTIKVTNYNVGNYNYSITLDLPTTLFTKFNNSWNLTTETPLQTNESSGYVSLSQEENNLNQSPITINNHDSLTTKEDSSSDTRIHPTNEYLSANNKLSSKNEKNTSLIEDSILQYEEISTLPSSSSSSSLLEAMSTITDTIPLTTADISSETEADPTTIQTVSSNKTEISSVVTKSETLELFTNFTTSKVTVSSNTKPNSVTETDQNVSSENTKNTQQSFPQPGRFELSDDEVLHLLSLGNVTNNQSRNHTVISQEAVNALSKYANVHTNPPTSTPSSSSATKDNKSNVDSNEGNGTDSFTTEKYSGEKITKVTVSEDVLSTKAISSHVNNNHAGIPILTKIYNKIPQHSGDKGAPWKATTETESTNLANATACPSNLSLRCGDGECISALSRCNQLVDCNDGSDEHGCSCSDYLKAQFLTRKLCDGVVDCWDFSDENNCEWCSPGQFVCPNSQVCVDQHRLCDGARDCPYGDDEKQCVTVAQTETTASDFPYSSEGYLMVRKQGRWGKLCLQNFDNVVAKSQSTWEVSDLGRAVCKAMTYSDFDKVNRTIDIASSSRADDSHYFELAYASDINTNTSQPRSSLSFQETQCNQKEVVHVSCRDLECGVRPQAINQWARIVGGGNAAPGSWPWQAALYKEGEFQCGATLIADRWLVSAGHCFYHALDDYWVARLGALRRGSSFPSPYEQLHPVSHIILHPGYVDAGFLNDISLLRLREPVQFSDFVRPVCLPPPPPAAPIRDGRLCTVVGWGQLFEVGRIFPDTLQEVQLPIISTAECRKRTLFLPLYRVTDNMFCAGFDRGGRDACLGDSGGPLMCQEKDGHWSLYGVTSNGYGCARANRPGVYTKVANYVPWLQAAMAQQVSSLRDSKTQCKGHRCPLGECLPSTRVCNGFMECSDGSDEKGCW